MTQEITKHYELIVAKVVHRECGDFATELDARIAASKIRKILQDADLSTEYFFESQVIEHSEDNQC
jgi:hypothetical protein